MRERHKNGTARVVVFERETCEKEDEKTHRFHIIISKIQTRDESPQNQDIIIVTTNARKQRERKKEHI